MYKIACRRAIIGTPLEIIGSRPLVGFGNESYELSPQN
jgi:hypothetical protein